MLSRSIAGGSGYIPGESDVVNSNREDSGGCEPCPLLPATSRSSRAVTIRVADNNAVNLAVHQEGEGTASLAEKTPLSRRKVSGRNASSWLSNTWGLVRRAARITYRSLSFYRASPHDDPARQFMKLGGLFGGKWMQFQAICPAPDFKRDSNSRFPASEVAPGKVVSVLQGNVRQAPESVSVMSLEPDFVDDGPPVKRIRLEVPIKYVKNLGRGTVCQIDHCDINGRSYAVKSVSEESVSNICYDAWLYRKCYLPALRWGGSLASSHVKGYDSALSSFVQEGNLLTELEHTKTQGRVLAELSRTNRYSIPVPEESSLADYIQQIPVTFKVPEVAEDFSSSEALVMELIDGCSLDRGCAIYKHFRSSNTAWGAGSSLLDTGDSMNIVRELWSLVERVYIQAARQSNFLNGDFQEGNFMMKMEYDHICIYFIDHGNCITVDNFDDGAQAVLGDCLLVDLFLFFHQRYHGKGQDDNLQTVSQYTELCQMASVMDLVVTQPLTDTFFQPYKEFINDWRDVFDCQQESEFTLQRYGQEKTVGAICRDMYQLCQLHRTWSKEAEYMNTEQDFIRGLLDFLSKAVKKKQAHK